MLFQSLSYVRKRFAKQFQVRCNVDWRCRDRFEHDSRLRITRARLNRALPEIKIVPN